MNPSFLSEPTEIWRSCEYMFTVEIEGDDFDYSFSQCTIQTCIHPDWRCPCDDVANLGKATTPTERTQPPQPSEDNLPRRGDSYGV